MKFFITNWFALFFILGTFGFGAFQGYYENKLQSAVFIIIMIFMFSGFSFDASVRGLFDLFSKLFKNRRKEN